MTFGSLFSGIGLFDYAAQECGLVCKWQVEIDEFCQKVLEKNFPNSEKFRDVKSVGKLQLKQVDCIIGGFPCQDASVLNVKGKGIQGEKTGLWNEYRRIIDEVRPCYVVIENVANLLNRGFEKVICDLAEIGFDSEWTTLRSSDFGASHQRERLFVIAYANGFGCVQDAVFKKRDFQSLSEKKFLRKRSNQSDLHIESVGLRYKPIPFDLRTNDERAGKLDADRFLNERIKAMGNAVDVECGKWIFQRLIEFEAIHNLKANHERQKNQKEFINKSNKSQRKKYG